MCAIPPVYGTIGDVANVPFDINIVLAGFVKVIKN